MVDGKANGGGTAIARKNAVQQKVGKVRDLLNRAMPQIELALPRWMDGDRFARITMTSLQLTPKLLDCEPVSLISAVMQCAQLGLEPDNVLGHAYLVPFKNKVQIIVGYRGIMRLARNSEDVASIEARAVYEKDSFDYKYGDSGRRMLSHVPSEEANTGALRAAYAICRFKGGGEVWEVVLPRHITKVKRSSASSGRSDSPWRLHEEEMWRKTAVRRLEPFLPLDANARRAFAVDEAGERGASQYLDLDITPDAGADNDDGLDALASASEGD
jgi:recombination protein RecT